MRREIAETMDRLRGLYRDGRLWPGVVASAIIRADAIGARAELVAALKAEGLKAQPYTGSDMAVTIPDPPSTRGVD